MPIQTKKFIQTESREPYQKKIFLERFIKNKKTISFSDIVNYQTYLKTFNSQFGKKLVPSTIKYYVGIILAVYKENLLKSKNFKELYELSYLIKQLKLKSSKPNPREWIPSGKELNYFFDKAPEKIQLLTKLYYYTGLRQKEGIEIRISDCTAVKNQVAINVSGKGDNARTVFIPKKLFDEIREFYVGRIYLLERNGKKLSSRSMNRNLKQYSFKFLNTKITNHKLRKSFSTHIYKKNKNAKIISDYLGNSPAVLFEYYIKDQLEPIEIYKTLMSKKEKQKYL